MPPLVKNETRSFGFGKGEGKTVLSDKLKMLVPVGSASVWRAYSCTLRDKGHFSFELEAADQLDDTPQEWLKGTIDLATASGVWLLGQKGFQHIDVIVGATKWTVAAANEATLESWHKEMTALMPNQPVQELCTGWLEKRGENNTSWKMRYFVLLSSRELIYYETDQSNKRKGEIDLTEVTQVKTTDEYYNYDDAFVLVSPKRQWVVCPESKKDKEMWLAALQPVIATAAEAAAAETAALQRAAARLRLCYPQPPSPRPCPHAKTLVAAARCWHHSAPTPWRSRCDAGTRT